MFILIQRCRTVNNSAAATYNKAAVNPDRQETGFRCGTIWAKVEVNDPLQSFVVLIKMLIP